MTLAMLGSPLHAAESLWDRGAPVIGKPTEMQVYRSPSCTCCGRWLEHMKRNGLVVKDIPTEDMDRVKRELGVPDKLQSCHTAVVEGYLVEGHVPAADVGELLTRRSSSAGLAVPGMPRGTPGMESGETRDPFVVMEFEKTGTAKVFRDYRSR